MVVLPSPKYLWLLQLLVKSILDRLEGDSDLQHVEPLAKSMTRCVALRACRLPENTAIEKLLDPNARTVLFETQPV